MGEKGSNHTDRSYLDREIGRRAGEQHGVVSREQLVALGVTDRMIERRLEAGRLHRLHRGVFAVGHVPGTPECRWSAAVLACGAQALLSHRSAGRAHAILGAEGSRPSVTVPLHRRPRVPGIEIHRAELLPEDMTHHRGIPVTSVARTLVDLAGVLGPAALRRAFREAEYRRCLDPEALASALERRPRPALAALLGEPRPHPSLGDRRPALTAAEDHLLDICARNRIRAPLTQRRLGPKRVDFVWLPERVVAEADGWQAHGTRTAYQEDRAVTNELQLLGYHVLRFTWEDLTRRRGRVAATIRRALAARG